MLTYSTFTKHGGLREFLMEEYDLNLWNVMLIISIIAQRSKHPSDIRVGGSELSFAQTKTLMSRGIILKIDATNPPNILIEQVNEKWFEEVETRLHMQLL